MAAPDLSVFGRQKTLVDQQRLQADFEAKKIQQALQSQALINQVTGQLTPKDQVLLGLQLQQFAAQQQNRSFDQAIKQEELGIKRRQTQLKEGPSLLGDDMGGSDLPMLAPQS